jgi:hypothetical protein
LAKHFVIINESRAERVRPLEHLHNCKELRLQVTTVQAHRQWVVVVARMGEVLLVTPLLALAPGSILTRPPLLVPEIFGYLSFLRSHLAEKNVIDDRQIICKHHPQALIRCLAPEEWMISDGSDVDCLPILVAFFFFIVPVFLIVGLDADEHGRRELELHALFCGIPGENERLLRKNVLLLRSYQMLRTV